jgi:spore maturation protein CgeB
VRILIVDTCYPAFLDAHYAARPELRNASYDVQWRALMGTFFGTSDSYSHYLAKVGHEAHEVVVNCLPLQKAWARDRGFRTRRAGFRPRVATPALVHAQAAEFAADVVYVQDLSALDIDTLSALRQRALLVGQIASEPPSDEVLRKFDLLLTSFPHYLDRFRTLGINSEYFRIGFDERVLAHVQPRRETDIAFVGGLGRTAHGRGNALLEEAAGRLPIAFWGYGVEGWPETSPIRRGFRGEAWGLEMFRVLAASRIALNRHIEAAEDNANNMRLYEATGVGTFLLTDAKRNLAELFEPGVEVETYGDVDELVEKARYYVDHEEARVAIAKAGQRRTLRDHTYARRMEELVALLMAHLP